MGISIKDKSDQELAADARMLAAALSRVRQELASRSIDVDMLCWDEGKVEIKITRVTKEPL